MAYHHGNLRAALLDAAFELGRTQGPAAIGMREVTRRAGVTVRAAYRHFADLDTLLAEVSELAMAELSKAITDRLQLVEATDPGENARQGLRAVGAGYVEFGLREPGLFDTAFHRTVGQESVQRTHPFQLLCLALDRLVEVGALTVERRNTAPIDCWASVHGFVVLHRGPLADLEPGEVDVALASLLDTVERGLVEHSTTTSPRSPANESGVT